MSYPVWEEGRVYQSNHHRSQGVELQREVQSQPGQFSQGQCKWKSSPPNRWKKLLDILYYERLVLMPSSKLTQILVIAAYTAMIKQPSFKLHWTELTIMSFIYSDKRLEIWSPLDRHLDAVFTGLADGLEVRHNVCHQVRAHLHSHIEVVFQ